MQPVVDVFLMLFLWCFLILGVVPGIWVSVHHAPTLRARRFLILGSLRLYGLFGLLAFFLLAFFTLQLMIRGFSFEPVLYSLVLIVGLGTICVAMLYMLIASPLTYRRIVREDTGLLALKNTVPLEESFLSLARLNRTFLRIGLFLLAVYTFGLICAIPDFQEDWAKLTTAGSACCGSDTTYTTILMRFYSQLAIAGAFFLLVFRQMHRSFLATAKDETSFRSASIESSNTNMSFRERVLYEWIISFGFFLAAGLVLLLTSLRFFWIVPPYPILFLGIMILLLGGSFFVGDAQYTVSALPHQHQSGRRRVDTCGMVLLNHVVAFRLV